MTEAPDCCRNCRFSVMEVVADRGTCNRHAPVHMSDTGWAVWPSISGLNWCGEWALHPDLAPPVTSQEAQAFADFLAHSDSIPGLNGIPVLPYPEQGPEPTGLQVTTYEDLFEDPLR
jgi:hypothetical protein